MKSFRNVVKFSTTFVSYRQVKSFFPIGPGRAFPQLLVLFYSRFKYKGAFFRIYQTLVSNPVFLTDAVLHVQF